VAWNWCIKVGKVTFIDVSTKMPQKARLAVPKIATFVWVGMTGVVVDKIKPPLIKASSFRV
jgi:hypothetical protein